MHTGMENGKWLLLGADAFLSASGGDYYILLILVILMDFRAMIILLSL